MLWGSGNPLAWFIEYAKLIPNIFQMWTDTFNSLNTNFGKFVNADFEWLQEFLNVWCRPSHPSFWVRQLFVPDGNVYEKMKVNYDKMLDEKLPFIAQIKELFSQLTNDVYEENIPRFVISIPQFGLYNQSIINFQYFTDYRPYILNFTRFSSWFFFIIKLYKRLPFLIQ